MPRRRMKRLEPYDCDGVGFEDVRRLPLFFALYRHAMRERRIWVATMVDEGHDFFVPDDGDDPRVRIRWDEARAVDQELFLTITLAHELGHHESWLRGEYSDELIALLQRDEPIYDDPDAIDRSLREQHVEEEARAWRYGREILARVVPDFPAFDEYDRQARVEVDGHRKGWGLA